MSIHTIIRHNGSPDTSRLATDFAQERQKDVIRAARGKLVEVVIFFRDPAAFHARHHDPSTRYIAVVPDELFEKLSKGSDVTRMAKEIYTVSATSRYIYPVKRDPTLPDPGMPVPAPAPVPKGIEAAPRDYVTVDSTLVIARFTDGREPAPIGHVDRCFVSDSHVHLQRLRTTNSISDAAIRDASHLELFFRDSSMKELPGLLIELSAKPPFKSLVLSTTGLCDAYTFRNTRAVAVLHEDASDGALLTKSAETGVVIFRTPRAGPYAKAPAASPTVSVSIGEADAHGRLHEKHFGSDTPVAAVPVREASGGLENPVNLLAHARRQIIAAGRAETEATSSTLTIHDLVTTFDQIVGRPPGHSYAQACLCLGMAVLGADVSQRQRCLFQALVHLGLENFDLVKGWPIPRERLAAVFGDRPKPKVALRRTESVATSVPGPAKASTEDFSMVGGLIRKAGCASVKDIHPLIGRIVTILITGARPASITAAQTQGAIYHLGRADAGTLSSAWRRRHLFDALVVLGQEPEAPVEKHVGQDMTKPVSIFYINQVFGD